MLAEETWDRLRRRVESRLIRVDPTGLEADLAALANPYYCQERPDTYQTTGWLGAYDTRPSQYAVAVRSAADIAAAVDFARETGVRLAVKGTGHDYLGRSRAPDSLLVWTHHLREVTLHDDFRPKDASWDRGVPAVTVGAGTRWLEVYHAAAERDWYVQGGGCTTVGAAGGFTQGGGFGHFSKRFGTAAGNVLQAEVVTADGRCLVVNEMRHPDLFWALRGGGGGTFGIVSALTFRAHPRPKSVGAVIGEIHAATDADYRELVGAMVRLVPGLDTPAWGEQVGFGPNNTVVLALLFNDLTEADARAVFAPLTAWLAERDARYSSDILFAAFDFSDWWNAEFWDRLAPGFIHRDLRAGQSGALFWWDTNQNEVSAFIEAYISRWLPTAAFQETPEVLADALFEASRHSGFSLHMNKGLAGSADEARARDHTTAINPVVFDAPCLMIMASEQSQVYPGVPGHEPDLRRAETRRQAITDAMRIIRSVTPGGGAYVNEADYFEPDWQHSFWGAHYESLLAIKNKYDP
ncbi:MAG: FAD-binding oxidoreductase, partial [Acidimicrobiaceae bacterium]|nr:FAD-binding oxidoreductase [Acidimicrobiaceae bacterium]